MEKRGLACRIELNGGGKSRIEEIDKISFVVGRGETADFRVTSSGVSRSHVSVNIKNNVIWLEDLGSSNGTFLNGKRLQPKVPIQYNHGDVVKLGLTNEILKFVLPVEKKVVKVEPVEIKLVDPNLPPIPPPEKLEGTLVDPNFKKKSIVLAQQPVPEEVMEEAKASALRIKIAAETEATKVIQAAKERALNEISEAREKAEEIISQANERSFRVQRETESESARMRQAMQETIERLRHESEQKAEVYRKEARDKGEALLNEYRNRADKTISDARMTAASVKAEAQKQSDEIVSGAYQKVQEIRASFEVEARQIQEDEEKKAEAIVTTAQEEADRILSEANRTSGALRSKLERDVEEARKKAEVEANNIKNAALTSAREIKNSAMASATEIEDAAETVVEELKQAAMEEITQVRLATEKDIANMRLSSQRETESLLARAKEKIEQERRQIVETAQEEGEKIRAEAIKAGKREAARLLSIAEEDRAGLSKHLEKLREEIVQAEKKRVDLTGLIKNLQTKHVNVSQELEQMQTEFRNEEVEGHKKIEALSGKVSATEALLATKIAEVDKKNDEAKQILDAAFSADKLMKEAQRTEQETLKNIEGLKLQQAQLSKGLETHRQQVEAEKKRQREAAEKELLTYKDEASAEVKRLREKASSDFNQKKSDLDAEIDKMKRKELEIIKNMRFEDEQRFRARRKHQILEVAKALETYLVPRIKEETKWKELPKSLGNFFPELKDIVERVIEGEFADIVANTGMDVNADPTIKAKKKKRKVLIAACASIAVTGIIVYEAVFDTAIRKSASEIYIEKLKEKEAAKPRFNPQLTDEYKGSYTDNVLYTKDYIAFKTNQDNQGKWIKDLNRFFMGDLGLNENAIVKFISLESNLVSQLSDLRGKVHIENEKDDIAKMTDLEEAALPEMIGVVGSEKNYQKFRNFEKDYISKNRAPAAAP